MSSISTKSGNRWVFILGIFLLGLLILVNWWIFRPADPELTYLVQGLFIWDVLERPSLYVLINLGTILFPFLLSFDSKVSFYKSWKYLFPSIFLTMAVFIPWDIVFTAIKVWGFNPSYYLAGSTLAGLPPGEWLFFITVPYACLFIYECLNSYVKTDWFRSSEAFISYGLMGFSIVMALLFWGNLYTSTTFILTAGLLASHKFLWKTKYLGRFYMSYVVSVIPFLIVNGALTGAFTNEPVVVYNDLENLGLRLSTIPLDDLAYSFLLLLMNTTWFELFRKQRN